MSHNVSPDIKINFVFALTSAQQRPGLQPTTSHFVATFNLQQMLPTPVSTNNTSVCQHQDVITLMVTASTCLDDCITRDGSNVLAEENVNKYEKCADRLIDVIDVIDIETLKTTMTAISVALVAASRRAAQ